MEIIRTELVKLDRNDIGLVWELAVQLMLARPELSPAAAVKLAAEGRRQLAREQTTGTSP